jgi:hypothetical protein
VTGAPGVKRATEGVYPADPGWRTIVMSRSPVSREATMHTSLGTILAAQIIQDRMAEATSGRLDAKRTRRRVPQPPGARRRFGRTE